MNLRRCLPLIASLFAISLGCAAQQSGSDSLVRLLSAASARQYEHFGEQIREVIGPARFLHNNTYLICDTAIWYIAQEYIEAKGHVQIIQDQTVLRSDNLTYVIPENTAQFRGSVVQLQDKDKNTLRTRWLDYNTKDSVAIFKNGGALRDKDGQIIESDNGRYDSKMKMFSFTDNVNMFTDSIFVKTYMLEYSTERSKLYFSGGIDAWRDEYMLSSSSGWYERDKELFYFNYKVHGMSDTQEMWADSLFYHRLTQDVELYGHAQVTDTTRDVSALAGSMVYVDSLSEVTLRREPAVIGVTRDSVRVDTVYLGADRMVYRTVPLCDVDAGFIAASGQRLSDMAADPIAEYRKKAAEEARAAAQKAAEEAAKNDPNLAAKLEAAKIRERQAAAEAGGGAAEDDGVGMDGGEAGDAPPDGGAQLTEGGEAADVGGKAARRPLGKDRLGAVDALPLDAADSLGMAADSSLVGVVSDSLSVASPVEMDSTKTGFITAVGNVRLFRKDMQMHCDSLEFSDLDSLGRLYRDPIVWNDGNRQYSADSIFVLIRDGAMRQASLLSNAFVVVQEDSVCYDQIRAMEMMAYFDSTMALSRFDGLGGANALFYLTENDALATANKTETKMLSAIFKDGNIDRVYYFDASTNDAYPVAQMTELDRKIKGFNWDVSIRPESGRDITTHELRPSQRLEYASRPRTQFPQTDIYFPGYMDGVYKGMAESEARKQARSHGANAAQDSLSGVSALRGTSVVELDSLAALPAESLAAAADSLAARADSVGVALVAAGLDSASVAADSTVAPARLSDKDLKALERDARAAEAERKRAARIAAREDRWAALDQRDSLKAAAKAEKRAAKLREQNLRLLKKYQKDDARDQARLERYKARYERRKSRAAARRRED